MKLFQLAILGGLAVAVFGVVANAGADSSSGRQRVSQQMTCGDFLRFDDDAKPEGIHWFARQADGMIDGDVTDRMVAPLVERCKAAPAARLASQVRAETIAVRMTPS